MLNQYVKRYQEKPSTNIHVDAYTLKILITKGYQASCICIYKSTNLHVDASTEKRDFAYKLRFYKKKIV